MLGGVLAPNQSHRHLSQERSVNPACSRNRSFHHEPHMPDQDSEAPPRPAWHALLGPIPTDAVPRRQPIASAEVLAGPTGWAVAGWEQLVLHLSAGADGLRTILVVLDGDGTLLSASDAVLYRTGPGGGRPSDDRDGPAMILQMSVGGRFEDDGSFH